MHCKCEGSNSSINLHTYLVGFMAHSWQMNNHGKLKSKTGSTLSMWMITLFIPFVLPDCVAVFQIFYLYYSPICWFILPRVKNNNKRIRSWTLGLSPKMRGYLSTTSIYGQTTQYFPFYQIRFSGPIVFHHSHPEVVLNHAWKWFVSHCWDWGS